MAKSMPTSRGKGDLPEGLWRPAPVEAWWRGWLRGWRLWVVVVSVVGVIGVWRGARDYRSFKSWRGRVCAERAVSADAAGRADEAQRLLDRAGVLAPDDPFVLRTIADFAERRSDMMALYALRQLEATGRAEESDLLRQARLALDSGQPELLPGAAVRRWAETPVERLDADALELGARWLALRGMEAAAEGRMRCAMELAAGRGQMGEARRLNLELAQLLASPASGPPGGVRLREAVTRWLDVAKDAGAGAPEISEALTRAAVVMTNTAARPEADDWREATMGELRAVLAYRMDTAPESSRLPLRLAHAELELQVDPLDRAVIARDLAEQTRSLRAQDALRAARWLQSHGFYGDVLEVVRQRGEAETATPDWRSIVLEAWLGRKDWGEARKALADSGGLFSEWQRCLWEYRIEHASGAGVPGPVRDALRDALRGAEGGDALQAAALLEALGDRPLAIEVYRQWQRHERFGLPARVGIVRCLHEETGEAAPLVEALQSLLTLAPHLDEARSDLAYLRLLPPQEPRREDVEAAKRLVAEAPPFLAYRVVAALAALRLERPAEALGAFGELTVPWDAVPAAWRVVRACSLAANGRSDEARDLARGIPREALRPGEVRLLEQYSLSPGP